MDVGFVVGLCVGIVLAVRLNGIDHCCVINGFAEGSELNLDGDVR